MGVPEREKARRSFSEELRYGHIGCFCFLISFISILFSLLLFLLCHCWSWMSIVEDWTLLSLSWLRLLCFCCYSLCFLSCLVFPEYEAVKGNESMGYRHATQPSPVTILPLLYLLLDFPISPAFYSIDQNYDYGKL